jgi:ubiquinone/menaquinone biosynthesis C-methylase UbiE
MNKLNFGCGRDIKEGWDNVDIQESKNLTKSFDFNKFPFPIQDNIYDFIYAKNILEHLECPDKVIMELRRIAKPNATLYVSVPHYTNKGAYSDLQHKHYFNEICFLNLVKPIDRKLIDTTPLFKLKRLEIIPTKAGRILPKQIREKLSLFINGLLSQIEIELIVIK